MKYIIVGGVAGGATAAARLRRLSEASEIILIERSSYISYANCGLPYYIGGVIPERDQLFVQTPEAFGRRFALDVRTEQEVIAIDREQRMVAIRRASGEIYHEAYDHLLLSPGASPIVPPISGADSQGVFTLRDIRDTDRIKAYVDTHQIRHAVVVGGGFIGIEMAENLHHRGIAVSIVEMAPQLMAPIDYSMANIVHEHLIERGVGLYLEKSVSGITSMPDDSLTVSFASGETLDADLVLLSIGVRPNSILAREAGLELGARGGIKVNEYLQTSDPYIWAVGDAIEYSHPITGNPWHNYLAGPANRQARIVAGNMMGRELQTYEGSIGTAIAKVFDLTVASTGLPAKALRQSNIEYQSVVLHPNSHAGYYPGASPMTLKMIYSPTSRKVLGAQAVGVHGVDKRIDVIASIIKQGGTVEHLMEVEQAYAPPYSSAKDPVAMAGYIADNIINQRVHPVTWREMQAADPTKVQILDVRTPAEYALGNISGSINIPVDELRQRYSELDSTRPIYVYCAVGLRGYLATQILRGKDFVEVRNLVGGYRHYRSSIAKYGDTPAVMAGEQSLQSDRTASASAQGGKDQDDTHQNLPSHKDIVLEIDASGICCPGPIMRLNEGIARIQIGERLRVTATDPGFVRDAQAWCESTGHSFIESSCSAGRYVATIERRGDAHESGPITCSTADGNGKTFILFSNDLDKVLATFVLANGAAATGQKVSIFFTFWGLTAITRQSQTASGGDLWARMFGWMLPKDSLGLGLSKMNMLGMGRWMMRKVMKIRGVDSLESLRQQAIEAGVEFIACQMSMDVMGITRNKLLPNVTIGGVATYMNRAERAKVNLFI